MEMEVDTPPQQLGPFQTVHVLQLIKDAQQQHGLRHGDYQRYRGYCGRRIYRVRKALKYNHNHKCVPKHKAKFQPKQITVETITDARFFEILIFEVERCWAFAMALKYDTLDDPLSRKKFFMRNKLRRALKHANYLEQMAKSSSRTDTTTKFEVQAYHAFIGASLCLELKQWANAAELYKKVKQIYEKLSSVVKIPELVELYGQRCREVQNTLKLCEYNIGDTSVAPLSELLQLSLSTTSDLTHEFDKLIAEAASRSNNQSSISWGGLSTPITNSNVRSIIDASTLLNEQINTTESSDDKVELYERFLGNCRDTIQKLNEENRKAAADNTGHTLNSVQITLSYLEYLRLKRANERYLVLISSVKHSGEVGERKVKPQDFLRLYSQIIENCQEIIGLPGATDDKQILDVYNFKIEYYKAHKCFYMAETYNGFGQFSKAAVLYDRALEKQKRSSDKLKKLKHPDITETEKSLSELKEKISSGSILAKTNQISEAAGEEEEEPATKKNVPLINNINEWRNIEVNKLKPGELDVSIVENPPNLEPMPCKPTFFDLALYRIEMPNLQKRIEELEAAQQKTPKGGKQQSKQPTQQEEQQQAQGLGSYVKGLFWGK